METPGTEPPLEMKREVQRLTKPLRRRDPNRKQGPSSAKLTGFLSLSRSRSKLETVEGKKRRKKSVVNELELADSFLGI